MLLIKTYWEALSIRSKVIHVIFVLVSLMLLYYAGGKAFYKYKYFKRLESEVKVLKKEKEASEFKIDSLIGVTQETTAKVKKKSKSIDKKRIRDEEIIDNKSYSDDELDEFLSDYQ